MTTDLVPAGRTSTDLVQVETPRRRVPTPLIVAGVVQVLAMLVAAIYAVLHG